MMFLRVAEVLMVNQFESYRVHRLMLAFDVLHIVSHVTRFLLVLVFGFLSLSAPSVKHFIVKKVASNVELR
ncbi:hypothetical protein [Archaeoglobus sp.]